MASDRVVIVRVLGIGNVVSSNTSVEFTSRAGLSYLGNEVPGVVVDVGSQLSSNIEIFGALGSDPTTTFTMLSTPVTAQLMLSRGKRPLLDADGANVTVTAYVKPFGASGLGEVNVTDTANASIDMMIRIANTVFSVEDILSATRLRVRRRWGSADVPIPMGVTGFGIFGATVYDVSPGNPTGGIESLPVVISTAPLSATSSAQEEIIFRGIVNKVTNDTSAKAQNRIKVDCGSMMSFVKSAKFTPAQGGTRVFPKRADLSTPFNSGKAQNLDFWWQIQHDQRLYGYPYEVGFGVGDTRVPLLQVRVDTHGGTVALDADNPWSLVEIDGFPTWVAQVSTRYRVKIDEETYMTSNAYLSAFREGWFLTSGTGPALDPAISIIENYVDVTHQNNQGTEVTTSEWRGYKWQTQDAYFNPEKLGETTFIAATFTDLIVDLLLGTVNGDRTFAEGCRAATESAWLPFGALAGVNIIEDIIDVPSLIVATSKITNRLDAIPQAPTGVAEAAFALPACVMLPYVHADAKTVGDVLDEILKRLGMYMVYDKCKFRFGRWSARPPTPTIVNDTGLAEPKVSLTFDRNNCVQTALMKVCWRADGDSPVTQSIPVNNVDLGIGALGKVVNVSHWVTDFGNIENLPSSDMFANAVDLVTRYSQAAALIDVVYRDDVFDLTVGQQVAFSSDYVPNPDGGLGVTLATGFVMKAARSWQTPTTAYTIALPGYLSPINRISVFSCSGTVVSVVGDDVVIAPNDFTLPAGQAERGSPTSDAEAFELSLQLQGGPINLVLRDQYGTYQGAAALLYPGDVSGNTLLGIPAISAVAVPGDVIVLSRATSQSSVATLWDAFQADTAGNVDGSSALAYKWVL